jgi:toxin ParE1/3/4
MNYCERIETFCRAFEHAAERGTKRSDLRPDLPIVGFGRYLTIAFHVDADSVIIDRVLYGRRDLAKLFKDKA